MKRQNRLAVLLAGLFASTGFIGVAAQEEPGPATEVMESFDISINEPGAAPFPPSSFPTPSSGFPGPMMMGMPPPGFQPMEGMEPPDELGAPEDLLALRPGSDLMMIRAGVQSSFTDEQLEKMYKAKMDFMDKAGPKMAELKSQERSLRDLLTQPEFDKSKAQSIQGKINGLKADLANLQLDQRISFLSCLSPEQHKELRRSYIKHADFGGMGMMMMRKFHGRMGKHHRGAGGGGPACKPGGDCPKPQGPGEKS